MDRIVIPLLLATITGLISAFCLYEILPVVPYLIVLAPAALYFVISVGGFLAEIEQRKARRKKSSLDPIWQRLQDAETNGTRRGAVRKVGFLQGLVLSVRYHVEKHDTAAVLALAKEREIKIQTRCNSDS